MKKLLGALTGLGLLVAGTSASAHVWNLGWKSTGGSLTFYGVSWHGGAAPLGPNSVDDFTANPAGFVINGSNFVFDIGSVTNMNDCVGAGGLTAGSCSPVWNALNLDGALHGSLAGDASDTYGKYAVKTMSPMELASVGIGTGSNAVTFTTFSPNATWASRPFSSATVPIDIVVTPPCGTTGQPACVVPEPAGLGSVALFGLGLTGLVLSRRRKVA